MKDRLLNEEERAEMREGIAAGLKYVKMPADSSPDALQEALKRVIDSLRKRFAKLSEDDAEHALWALASLWGDSVVREVGWEWVIAIEGRDEWHAISPPNRSHLVYPFHILDRLLTDRRSDQTSLLLYNMLKSGDLPKSKRGNHLAIC
jgi:hypothetical protein